MNKEQKTQQCNTCWGGGTLIRCTKQPEGAFVSLLVVWTNDTYCSPGFFELCETWSTPTTLAGILETIHFWRWVPKATSWCDFRTIISPSLSLISMLLLVHVSVPSTFLGWFLLTFIVLSCIFTHTHTNRHITSVLWDLKKCIYFITEQHLIQMNTLFSTVLQNSHLLSFVCVFSGCMWLQMHLYGLLCLFVNVSGHHQCDTVMIQLQNTLQLCVLTTILGYLCHHR